MSLLEIKSVAVRGRRAQTECSPDWTSSQLAVPDCGVQAKTTALDILEYGQDVFVAVIEDFSIRC